jgi:hypothetical protein
MRGRPGISFLQSKSTPKKLAGFYEANPDEALTYADIALKFECTQDVARMAFRRLRQLGLVGDQHLIRRDR